MVASMFSPVGKALAAWITSMVPDREANGLRNEQLAEQVREVAEVLADVSESVRRSSQVQEQTAEALVQVQQSLAILLDRTPR
jgi:aminopeptidase C